MSSFLRFLPLHRRQISVMHRLWFSIPLTQTTRDVHCYHICSIELSFNCYQNWEFSSHFQQTSISFPICKWISNFSAIHLFPIPRNVHSLFIMAPLFTYRVWTSFLQITKCVLAVLGHTFGSGHIIRRICWGVPTHNDTWREVLLIFSSSMIGSVWAFTSTSRCSISGGHL